MFCNVKMLSEIWKVDSVKNYESKFLEFNSAKSSLRHSIKSILHLDLAAVKNLEVKSPA